MSVKFANNAFGTLNAGINNSATSITLSSGQGARFPTLASGEYFYATLIDTSNNLEVVKCTARSTDVLTVTRAQESTTAQAFAIGDRIELRVTAQGLDDAANPYDKDTSSTGSLALPVGTTAQQPTAADTEGHIRYDSDDSVVYYSDGANWLKISSVIATLSSVTGNIYAGASSTLTLAGQGFQSANLVVNFTQSSDSIDEDVSVTPTSDTAATVTVPAAVYNNVTAGNVVSIIVTNSDGIASAAVTKTAVAMPSGGTVTTSGGYRIHTFTSTGNFVVPSGVSVTADYLIVAGGGGGGSSTYTAHRGAGGGGAGGMRYITSTAISAGTYSAAVGGGGAGRNNGTTGGGGGNSSFNGTVSNGGGGGGGHSPGAQTAAGTGGSGGGGTNGFSGAAGTSGQGNAGGNGGANVDDPYCGGGGGGKGVAGSAGVNNSGGNDPGGNGGAGSSNSITGTAVTYAGGGGGNGSSGGSGGSGGGGNGGASSSTAQGVGVSHGGTNLGGGGGGSQQVSGNGGSGVVIIRYQLS